ncbi:hypothetical protein SOVF_133960 [Spinacia oleracea]|nr:hypothetical protein SOVF_133960 [Spinacia oleracea]
MEDQEHDTVSGTIDYKGRPAVRSKYGRWTSSSFLICVEVAESIVFYGISGNLISFLTENLGQSTAAAAANINAWKGVGCMLPILGAAIADTYVGKYYTIVASSVIYILGLGLLTISAALPWLTNKGSLQKVVFFVALYLADVGRGGHRPCIQAFGADQFDGNHPMECKAKSSFFNWWSFGISVGALLGLGLLSYVQDNISWGLGFGIPCGVMVTALIIFLLGSMSYRYTLKVEGESPFRSIGRVFVRAARNWNATLPVPVAGDEEEAREPQPQPRQLRFLDKALIGAPNEEGNGGKACSESEVEEAKAILRLFPIWAITFIFAIVYAQHGTLVIKQGVTLDRKIGSKFTIPAASLQCVMDITILILVPIYDYMIVPAARKLTGKPAGITMLQRVGIGLFLSIITMVVSAVIENKRLKTASRHGMIDSPDATVPMSFWWLVPQYVLFGMTDFCTMTGLQEFFYDQVPNEISSVGLALYAMAFKSREDHRKQFELEEARKAGLAPAEVDEDGKEINPHIPQYMSSAPWYLNSNKPLSESVATTAPTSSQIRSSASRNV